MNELYQEDEFANMLISWDIDVPNAEKAYDFHHLNMVKRKWIVSQFIEGQSIKS